MNRINLFIYFSGFKVDIFSKYISYKFWKIHVRHIFVQGAKAFSVLDRDKVKQRTEIK